MGGLTQKDSDKIADTVIGAFYAIDAGIKGCLFFMIAALVGWLAVIGLIIYICVR